MPSRQDLDEIETTHGLYNSCKLSVLMFYI